jgi:hypothetical protein
MGEAVMVEIPVTPEVAEALRADARRREAVGNLVSRIVRPSAEGDGDPLAAFLDALPRAADAPDMSPEEIAAEIGAYRAELRP